MCPQKELIAVIFASKSSTSESEWFRIISGDISSLSPYEIHEVSSSNHRAPSDRFRLLKKLATLRMDSDDAEHIIRILNNLGHGASMRQVAEGRVSKRT